ncbi:MAG: NTP transferase domain-containing protein [Synergistaceae bacterium]|nr:NTP transferase domain-containing protein [Synergistaceae bacterium]
MTKLNRSQFTLLALLEAEKNCLELSRRVLCERTKLSAEIVSKTLKELDKTGLVQDGAITSKGLDALEPYRVRRAVILAAGFGARMIPITLNTPKPLVRVKGVRLIDTILDALQRVGITDVTIVRGYLAEQFDQLLYKYSFIRFAENPAYNETNNISSMMCVRYMLQNAYVCEADLWLRNQDLITKYQYDSNYLGTSVEITDDWCFESKGGVITKISVGGRNCHLMRGISYWTERDGLKLAEHVKQVYEMPGGKERFWDQVPLEYFSKDYKVTIRECDFEDVVEIDTYNELKKLDSSYVIPSSMATR